jgi:hypothetical protein
MTVSKRVAALLRRWANRLDPAGRYPALFPSWWNSNVDTTATWNWKPK